MTVLSNSVSVEIGGFVPDVKESGYEVVDISDGDNAGVQCHHHQWCMRCTLGLLLCCSVGHPQQAAAHNILQACILCAY